MTTATLRLGDKVLLTTEHAASSYGIPVAVIDGQAYGPGDATPLGPTREVVARLARAHGLEAHQMVRSFLGIK